MLRSILRRHEYEQWMFRHTTPEPASNLMHIRNPYTRFYRESPESFSSLSSLSSPSTLSSPSSLSTTHSVLTPLSPASPPKRSASPVKQAVDILSPPVLCPICLDATPNTACIPCGHLLCELCAAKLIALGHSCCTCRYKIENTVRIWPEGVQRVT